MYVINNRNVDKASGPGNIHSKVFTGYLLQSAEINLIADGLIFNKLIAFGVIPYW